MSSKFSRISFALSLSESFFAKVVFSHTYHTFDRNVFYFFIFQLFRYTILVWYFTTFRPSLVSFNNWEIVLFNTGWIKSGAISLIGTRTNFLFQSDCGESAWNLFLLFHFHKTKDLYQFLFQTISCFQFFLIFLNVFSSFSNFSEPSSVSIWITLLRKSSCFTSPHGSVSKTDEDLIILVSDIFPISVTAFSIKKFFLLYLIRAPGTLLS